uniref:Uncharacterized protein n=1 Tax=Arundo donax TaxID=35708 RepID=A0A0A8YXA2_ARUDO
MAVVDRTLAATRQAHPHLMLPLLHRLPLRGCLQRYARDVTEGGVLDVRRGEAGVVRGLLPADVEVGWGDDVDGPLDGGGDLRG